MRSREQRVKREQLLLREIEGLKADVARLSKAPEKAEKEPPPKQADRELRKQQSPWLSFS